LLEIINIISLVILVFLTLLFIINLVNLIYQKKIYNIKNDLSFNPFISVLVPARNEEKNIEQCIKSVLEQSYTNYELIVLDDNSDDKTGEILNSIDNPQFRHIKGKEKPVDWVGKNFACHQLYEEAKGEYLLFIDADTYLRKNALSGSVLFLNKYNPDLVSLMPKELALTFWENIIIPMLHFTVLTLLPMPLVEHTKKESLTMSNGQFMLFRKSFYESIGGHKNLKNKMVEDVWLGRKVKKSGGKLIFADGTGIISCRMYTSYDEIVEGFSKNIFPGLSFSYPGMIFVIFLYSSLYLIPFFLLLPALMSFSGGLLIINLINILIPVIIRIMQSIKYELNLFYSFLHFLSVIMILKLAVNSYKEYSRKGGAVWKNRTYKINEVMK